jgi:hypothetical protein
MSVKGLGNSPEQASRDFNPPRSIRYVVKRMLNTVVFKKF